MARESGRAALTLPPGQRKTLEELAASRTAPVREALPPAACESSHPASCPCGMGVADGAGLCAPEPKMAATDRSQPTADRPEAWIDGTM